MTANPHPCVGLPRQEHATIFADAIDAALVQRSYWDGVPGADPRLRHVQP